MARILRLQISINHAPQHLHYSYHQHSDVIHLFLIVVNIVSDQWGQNCVVINTYFLQHHHTTTAPQHRCSQHHCCWGRGACLSVLNSNVKTPAPEQHYHSTVKGWYYSRSSWAPSHARNILTSFVHAHQSVLWRHQWAEWRISEISEILVINLLNQSCR